jgi:hypothetical protein
LFIVFWGFVHGVLGRSASINLLLLLAGPLSVTWKAAGWPRFRGDTTHVSNVVAGALMMTVFISLAGWLAFVNYNTSYFCKATHELAPPQNPRPQTLLLLSLRHRSHLTGGTLGSGLGFRIWV